MSLFADIVTKHNVKDVMKEEEKQRFKTERWRVDDMIRCIIAEHMDELQAVLGHLNQHTSTPLDAPDEINRMLLVMGDSYIDFRSAHEFNSRHCIKVRMSQFNEKVIPFHMNCSEKTVRHITENALRYFVKYYLRDNNWKSKREKSQRGR